MENSIIVAKHEDGSCITVHLQGAHLTSWRRRDGEELLYTSPHAIYKQNIPIRGGVPLIFPQFGNLGPLPAHGFARVRMWKVKEIKSGVASFTLDVPCEELLFDKDISNKNNSSTTTTTSTTSSSSSSSVSSGVVSLCYTITFSNEKLELHIEVLNNNNINTDVEFAFAFHTYFAITDAEKTLVNGVNLTPYIDNLDKKRKIHSPKPLWTFRSEVDRTYLNQSCAVLLMDMEKQRSTHISSVNLPDLVVWNPWVEKTKRLKDLPQDGYKHFACVEHGVIGKKIKLPPSGVWKASQNIILLNSSSTTSISTSKL